MSQSWLYGFERLLTTIFNHYFTLTSSDPMQKGHISQILLVKQWIDTIIFGMQLNNFITSLMLVLIPNISLLPSTSLMISDVEIPTIIFLLGFHRVIW